MIFFTKKRKYEIRWINNINWHLETETVSARNRREAMNEFWVEINKFEATRNRVAKILSCKKIDGVLKMNEHELERYLKKGFVLMGLAGMMIGLGIGVFLTLRLFG